MSTEETPLLSDVRTWLERGGYILEMKVARALSSRTNLIVQGEHYEDPLTKKDREIDVSAAIYIPSKERSRTHALHTLIECKNTMSPWIFFTGHSAGKGSWLATRYLDSRDCDSCRRILMQYVSLLDGNPEAYAVTEKKKNGRDQDHAYEAVQQVASALIAEFHSVEGGGTGGHGGPYESTSIGMPVVVTTSPLIVCTLAGNHSVRLEQVDRVFVRVARSDLPTGNDGIDVWVCSLPAFEELVDDYMERVSWYPDMASPTDAEGKG